MKISIEACWAKTSRESGLPAQSIFDHSVNTGSVAGLVFQQMPRSTRSRLPQGCVTLAALHDIGKIFPGFLVKCDAWNLDQLRNPDLKNKHHAEVGHWHLCKWYLKTRPENCPYKGRRPPDCVMSVNGHHGSYSVQETNLVESHIDEEGRTWPNALRNELLNDMEDMFGMLPTEPEIGRDRMHLLTGFITFCDWLASNETWFALNDMHPLKNYCTLESAQRNAQRAIEATGWGRTSVRDGLKFHELFGASDLTPRPLQQALVAAADEPGLYLVEASMGEGKTEAALAAAYRRWTSGDERGLYFALPTQLTSNRIHERSVNFLKNVAEEESFAALAHGSAWLREDRVMSFAGTPPDGEKEKAAFTHEANHWLNGGRRSLLAPFGTGTIDQALMAILPARHRGLRLFGLAGKVVVLDEVHSYDAYTSHLVDELIRVLIGLGGTVIVTSATLSEERRRQLISAPFDKEQRQEFAKEGGAKDLKLASDFPLITKVTANSKTVSQIPVAAANPTPKIITIRHCLQDDESVWAEALEAARAKACVLIIRNTVAKAQELYQELMGKRCEDGPLIGLLHSRFQRRHRDEHEDVWMRRLGNDREHRPENGCLLIATQVAEQSVDLDADLLITDLAPSDLLLQRIGRLHRHGRKDHDDLQRPSGFERPACWICHPVIDESATAKEIKCQMGASAHVYPPSTLYLAHRFWRDRSEIQLPNDIRTIVETTYGEIPNLSEGLQELLDEERATIKKLIATAMQANSSLMELADEEGVQTRYGMDSSRLLVILDCEPTRHSKGHLEVQAGKTFQVATTHRAFDFQLARELHRYAVQVPGWVLFNAKSQPEWFQRHVRGAVLGWKRPDSNEVVIYGIDEATSVFRFSYCQETGFTYPKKSNVEANSSYIEDEMVEDSWF